MKCSSWLCSAFFCLLLAACGGGSGSGDDPLRIDPALLPGGVSGAVYGATLVASGGSERGYEWDLESGTLPDGVGGLPASGITARLFGTVGAGGDYTFTVRLTDDDDNVVTRTYTVTINMGGGGGGGGTATTSTVNAPAGRARHTAVWTGTEMIVWGGFNMIAMHVDGGAYNPATDTWRALSTVGAPAARFDHTAVWSGTEMLVFGGSDNAGPVATGGAYNPATNTWRPLPSAGAPQARSAHTATWTGVAMLVYGGQGVLPPPAPNSVDLVFADGAFYDPAANQWTAIAAGGQAHRAHTTVWTGTQVVTWGGRDAFALSLNTHNLGAVFDTPTNMWSATSPAGAPSARLGHTAVWSGGTGMLVWGGTTNGITRLATGARYLPGTNAWAPMSAVGAAAARLGHTAVWTGLEMLVWGGLGAAGLLGDGAAYRAGTNTWRALPALPFPFAARNDHTAVWTGTQMIIWGGASTPADTYLATGARITP